MNRPPSAPQLRWSDILPRGRGTSWARVSRGMHLHFTHSGRAAIYQHLASMRRETDFPSGRTVVLVPAFHCPTVVDPVLHAGYDVRFYGVDDSLNVVNEDFLRKLDHRVAAAVFIRYFGFANMQASLVAACRDAGVRIIEDCCHSFLSTDPLRLAYSGADATIYSFWKLVPCLVGGGVLLRAGHADSFWLSQFRPSYDDSWSRMKTFGRHLADELAGSARRIVGARRIGRAEHAVPIPAIRRLAADAYPYDATAAQWGMPLSARLILASADLEAMSNARRRNFAVLGAALRETSDISAVYRDLAADTCPWGFPVRLKRRAERDYLMRARGVPVFTFGEVLHPLLFSRHRGEVSMLDMSRFLSESILAFPVHQGLNQDQVTSFANTVNDFIERL